MNTSRIGYLLTTNEESARYIFSKNLLEKIGFTVHCVKSIPHENKMLSNKLSMQYIYDKIQNSEEGFYYVFEDDINILDNITLDEIIEYEKISKKFFYLGICEYGGYLAFKSDIKIYGHDVYYKQGYAYGLHAIGINNVGAKELLEFSKKEEFNELYLMDVILNKFCAFYNPAYVVRYDLEYSEATGHKGIMFQDRKTFPSMITPPTPPK
jgi:hypothetical protein